MPNEFLISLFIDDELDLKEKAAMVRCLGSDPAFVRQTLSFLELEQSLRAPATETIPLPRDISKPRRLPAAAFLRVAAAFLVVVCASVFGVYHWTSSPEKAPSPVSQRFVIYLPQADRVEIAGTFTSWKRLPLNRLGSSGYWEINLNLKQGEHRFSYIVGGDRAMADPTILATETDDFGGTNSVIMAGDRA